MIEASDQQLPGHPEYPGVTARFRSEVFNAVISGASGIIYFPQRIGGGFLYDNMNSSIETEMKSVNAAGADSAGADRHKEPSAAGITVSGSLRATWRKYGGSVLYRLEQLDVGGDGDDDDQRRDTSSASVDGESRSVAIKSGKITDTFKPMQAHVYVV